MAKPRSAAGRVLYRGWKPKYDFYGINANVYNAVDLLLLLRFD
jgi:hypothetical protein